MRTNLGAVDARILACAFVVSACDPGGANPEAGGGSDGRAGSPAAAGSSATRFSASGGAFALAGQSSLAPGSGGTSTHAHDPNELPDGAAAGPSCGDGVVDPGEACDDGNNSSGDGCIGTCTAIERDFACPNPGSPCVSMVACGDGKISGDERCDDGNGIGGDGCSNVCNVEAGWHCPVAGRHCVAARCGDGIRAGSEPCDDGNGDNGDGCSSRCALEQGFACSATPGQPSACQGTVCGDGRREGFEQCDDGGLVPYDGCSPTCTLEPRCANGACSAVCGDGFKFPQEECDDGNTSDEDGCSATCRVEPGYRCDAVLLTPPSELVVPILYRDFRYAGTPNGHPDFQGPLGTPKGIAQSALDSEGKPILGDAHGAVTSADSFYAWYHDRQPDGSSNPYEKLVYLDASGRPTSLVLSSVDGGAYRFSSSAFFPLDGLGWNAAITPQVDLTHNFAFTSELHYQFTYQGGENLAFAGDDDVFVFINGKLAVDLGGVHYAETGSITLDAEQAAKLELVPGGMYEIALFQAERHTPESNYTLTLTGFTRMTSRCASVCGDGIVTSDELCDDGTNDGSYGGCMPGCRARGPFCGDGVVQGPSETCDDGVNQSAYGTGCAPGCALAPSCGDGKVDSRFGEQCDDGLNDGRYGGCAGDCQLASRCGDGQVQPDANEQCDDGNLDDRDGCTNRCAINAPR